MEPTVIAYLIFQEKRISQVICTKTAHDPNIHLDNVVLGAVDEVELIVAGE